MAFHKFIQAAAGTARMLNYREISRDVGVSEPTVRSWFGVLRATGLVEMIHPYFRNTAKRLLKTPKFYFMDTGLCCYLTGWTNPEVLEKGAMAGPMLETYAVSEIIKSYIHNGASPRVYYYCGQGQTRSGPPDRGKRPHTPGRNQKNRFRPRLGIQRL